jgi:hypothetical protein
MQLKKQKQRNLSASSLLYYFKILNYKFSNVPSHIPCIRNGSCKLPKHIPTAAQPTAEPLRLCVTALG